MLQLKSKNQYYLWRREVKTLKIQSNKGGISKHNDPIFPDTPIMSNEALKEDFTQTITSPLHKKAQKDIVSNHQPLSTRKPRQIPGRHH